MLVLGDDSAFGDRVKGELGLLDCQVFARDWVALGDGGKDEGLVVDHCWWEWLL